MQVTRDDVLRFRVRAQQLDRTGLARRRRDPRPRRPGHRPRRRCAGRWRSAAASVPGRGPRLRLDAARRAARLPAHRGRGGGGGGRAAERGRRGQADLRRLQAAEGGRHPRASTRSSVIAGEMRDIVRQPDGEGRDVARARPSGCRRRTSAGAGCARPPTPTSSRSGCPPCRPAWSSSPAPRRRCCTGSAAGAVAAKRVPDHLDPVRGVLRFLGPATPKQVAGYVDSPVKEIEARWPEDVVPVEVDGERLDDARRRRRRPDRSRAGRRGAAARARSTCSSRAGTASWSCPTRPPARTSGAPSAGPAECSRARGGRQLAAAVVRQEAGIARPVVRRQAPKAGRAGERLAAFRGQTFDGFD